MEQEQTKETEEQKKERVKAKLKMLRSISLRQNTMPTFDGKLRYKFTHAGKTKKG